MTGKPEGERHSLSCQSNSAQGPRGIFAPVPTLLRKAALGSVSSPSAQATGEASRSPHRSSPWGPLCPCPSHQAEAHHVVPALPLGSSLRSRRSAPSPLFQGTVWTYPSHLSNWDDRNMEISKDSFWWFYQENETNGKNRSKKAFLVLSLRNKKAQFTCKVPLTVKITNKFSKWIRSDWLKDQKNNILDHRPLYNTCWTTEPIREIHFLSGDTVLTITLIAVVQPLCIYIAV